MEKNKTDNNRVEEIEDDETPEEEQALWDAGRERNRAFFDRRRSDGGDT